MNEITIDQVKNSTDPQFLSEVLKRGKNDYVSRYAASNPNCPPEILSEVLKRGKDDSVSYCAASNPHCPPEALSEVLKRGNDDGVSRNAAENPNCPVLEKIHWMRAVGLIGVEDPSKGHIVEYDDEPQKEDEDLKKLRELVKGKNNNRYKTAQIEKKPYKIYKIEGGQQEKEIISLNYIWAYSAEQARMFAFKKMPALREFVEYCRRSGADCDVLAKLDMKKLEEIRKIKEVEKRLKEKQIQEAWWNQ